jgi:hypothetical protein
VNITQLKISNFKKITAVTITPDGNVVTIAGKNGQGKSSVLDAIMVALCGKSAMPEKPVRDGEDTAEIVLEVDGYTVKRTIRKDGGGTVQITTADGLNRPQPQTWLDGKIGKLTFDPSAFMRMRASEQSDLLRRLTGVDVSDLDDEKARVFSERTQVGRDRDTAQGALTALPFHPDAPAQEVSLADLIAEQNAAAVGVAKKHELALQAKTLQNTADTHGERIKELSAQADALTNPDAERDAKLMQINAECVEEVSRLTDLINNAKRIAEANVDALHTATAAAWVATKAKHADFTTRIANNAKAQAEKVAQASEATAQAEAIVTADPSEMQHRIVGLESINGKVRANAKRAEVKEKHEWHVNTYKDKTERLAAIADERAKRIAVAKMPVDGLSFGEDGAVTFKDVPLTQASQAEVIRVSMAIGLALNPDLKIVLIRDGSLLDSDSKALVAELAENAGAQVWMEVVGNEGGGIVIEDGAVRAA